MIDTLIIGDADLRGRYLPTALVRFDNEAFLGHAERSALCNFQDPDTRRRLSNADIETLHTAARAERGEDVPIEERGAHLWNAAWEVLEDAEGLSYIDRQGTEWMIRRNANGDLVLIDETAREAVQYSHVELCQHCASLVFGGEGDAEQERERTGILEAIGTEDDRDLTALDEADLFWLGKDALQEGESEGECEGCDCFAPLTVYVDIPSFDRDYAELQNRNLQPPKDEPDCDCPRFD